MGLALALGQGLFELGHTLRQGGFAGPGSLARLPTYLVGVLANLSGLGDEAAVVRTEAFALEELLRASR